MGVLKVTPDATVPIGPGETDMDFDQSDLRALAELTDEIGVLSIYVTADPREESGGRHAWQGRIRGELSSLRERMKAELPRERFGEFEKRLSELEPLLHRLLQAAEPGLGRAMFAAIRGAAVQTIKVQLPVPDLVTLRPAACVRPLVRVAGKGAPVGVTAISQDQIRFVDLRYGRAEDVQTIELSVDMDDWRQMSGPAGANPSHGQGNVSLTDRFDRRVEDHLGRLLKGAASDVSKRAAEYGWRKLVVAGDMRLVETLTGELPKELRHKVLTMDRILNPLSAAQVAETVAPAVNAARRSDERELAVRARDAAGAGATGVFGLSDTLGALNEGRVTHLLLDEARDWSGRRAPDGRLAADEEQLPGTSSDELTLVTDLGERMIERALVSGAEVTLLGEEAAAELADAGGVAAILRW